MEVQDDLEEARGREGSCHKPYSRITGRAAYCTPARCYRCGEVQRCAATEISDHARQMLHRQLAQCVSLQLQVHNDDWQRVTDQDGKLY